MTGKRGNTVSACDEGGTTLCKGDSGQLLVKDAKKGLIHRGAMSRLLAHSRHAPYLVVRRDSLGAFTASGLAGGPCSVSLRGIKLSVLPASEQLLEDFMVHGEQLAVALVELLALVGQLADPLPMLAQRLAALA